MQEEADAKVQLAREELSNDHKDKLTKQEERFTAKRKELQDRINALGLELRPVGWIVGFAMLTRLSGATPPRFGQTPHEVGCRPFFKIA